jgi:hypothetical protein
MVIARARSPSGDAYTAWFWTRPDAVDAVDVLFVDEAAKMSLANVLAVSQAAKTIVLLGDPQQLDQPTQGTHPEGVDTSALDHMLGGHQTIPEDRGLFLEETWRLHPTICAFTSGLFYEGRLRPRSGLELQKIRSTSPLHGSGLRYRSIAHTGNQSSSPEEAEVARALVNVFFASKAHPFRHAAPRAKREQRKGGLSSKLETVVESIKNLPWTALAELKKDERLLKKIDEASVLLETFAKDSFVVESINPLSALPVESQIVDRFARMQRLPHLGNVGRDFANHLFRAFPDFGADTGLDRINEADQAFDPGNFRDERLRFED